MKPALPILAVLFPTVLAGCVARDAGYEDVRKTVAARTGHDVRWQAIEDGSVASKRTRQLLAAPLTVDSAIQIALLNSAKVQSAFEEIGVARAELVSAISLPNPSVEAALLHHIDDDKPPDLAFRAKLSLSRLLFLPWKGGAANAELDARSVNVAGAVLDVAFVVRHAFYQHQADTQIVELLRSVARGARASYEAAVRIHAAGNMTDLDLANEQALYEQARLDLSQVESNLLVSRERLTALMGLWGRDTGFRIEGRLADPPEAAPDVRSLERKALERSLDLSAARKLFTAAARKRNVARAEGLLPELSAGAEAERDDEEWKVGPVAELELPLFYQGQGEVAAAEAEMRREQQRHRALATAIRAAARASASRLLIARERALYIKTVLLPLRERIVTETQLAYNAMTVGVFQLLESKRAQIQAGRAYVEALRGYWTARAEMDQLLAGRLPARWDETQAPIEAPASGRREAH
jgi:outer membrane protein, heavy metal efflux system